MVLAIYGTGGSGREIYEIVMSEPSLRARWQTAVFIDDISNGHSIYGADVLSFDDLSSKYSVNEAEVIIAVGEPTLRETLFKKADSAGYSFATIVHPRAFVAPSVQLGRGVFIKMQSIVSSGAVLEDNIFVQSNAIIGHDVHVHSHCQISAYAHISGAACLGERCYLGVRASIREKSKIGDDVVLAMGAVAMEKNIPSNVLVAGNPAKYVRRKAGSKVFS